MTRSEVLNRLAFLEGRLRSARVHRNRTRKRTIVLEEPEVQRYLDALESARELFSTSGRGPAEVRPFPEDRRIEVDTMEACNVPERLADAGRLAGYLVVTVNPEGASGWNFEVPVDEHLALRLVGALELARFRFLRRADDARREAGR